VPDQKAAGSGKRQGVAGAAAHGATSSEGSPAPAKQGLPATNHDGEDTEMKRRPRGTHLGARKGGRGVGGADRRRGAGGRRRPDVGPRCQREGERERVKRAGVGYWAGGASRARGLLLVGRGEKEGREKLGREGRLGRAGDGKRERRGLRFVLFCFVFFFFNTQQPKTNPTK
jgi:hypothetical protein